MKLEKIEYGGVKGHLLSEQTQGIFTEFNDHYKVFTDSAYDPLDLDDDVSRIACWWNRIASMFKMCVLL